MGHPNGAPAGTGQDAAEKRRRAPSRLAAMARGALVLGLLIATVPATLVVSADGRVVRKLEMGALSAEALKGIIESPQPAPR